MSSRVARIGCRCLCHDGYGEAHPDQRCPCNGGPENEWTRLPPPIPKRLPDESPKGGA